MWRGEMKTSGRLTPPSPPAEKAKQKLAELNRDRMLIAAQLAQRDETMWLQ